MAEDFNPYHLVDPTSNQDDQDVSSFISTSSDEDDSVATPQFDLHLHQQQEEQQHHPSHHHHRSSSVVGDEQVALILTDLPTVPHSTVIPSMIGLSSPNKQSSHHHDLKPPTTLSNTQGSSNNTLRVGSSAASSVAMMRGGTQFLLQQQGGTASIDSSFLQPYSVNTSVHAHTIIPPPSIATVGAPSTSASVVVNVNNNSNNANNMNNTLPSSASALISSNNTPKTLPTSNKGSSSTTLPNDSTTQTSQSVTVKNSPKRKRVSSNSSNQPVSNVIPQKSSRPTQQSHQQQPQHSYDSEISDSTPPVPSNNYNYPNMLHSPAMMQPFYLNGMSHDPGYLYSQPDVHWYSHYPNQLWNYYSYPTQSIPTTNPEEQNESLVQDYSTNQTSTETDATQQNVEGTIYVNPKQYQRILKRRIARAKLEQQMKNAGQYKDKSYKYNSRHEWAKKRARGPGGRFLSKKEKQELEEREKGGDVSSIPTVEPPSQPSKSKKQAKKKPKTDTNTQSNTTSSLPQPFLNHQSFLASIPPNFSNEFLSLPTHQHNYKSM